MRVTAVDRKGRRVLSAHDLLHIEVKGEADIVAVGNGDMASSELPVGDKTVGSPCLTKSLRGYRLYRSPFPSSGRQGGAEGKEWKSVSWKPAHKYSVIYKR